MAPKKTFVEQLRARLSPIRGHPEEGSDVEQREFNPPLNHKDAMEFDKIVGTPLRKDKSSASGSTSATSTRITSNHQDDFILQQSAKQEQLKRLILLVSSLGSKVESVAEIVPKSSSSKRVKPPEIGPSQQEKGKAATRKFSFVRGVDGKEDGNDGNDNTDDEFGIKSGDDYVSHNLYRGLVA
jgi:hypothetical protein